MVSPVRVLGAVVIVAPPWDRSPLTGRDVMMKLRVSPKSTSETTSLIATDEFEVVPSA